MLNSIEDILELHEGRGKIEDSFIEIHFGELTLKLNIFTLRFFTVNGEKSETKRWNKRLEFEIRKNRELYKEIKEYRVLFETFNRLKIKSGYLEKSECPDFILWRNGKSFGIELTKIYSGNDWVAEKIHNDIKTFGIEPKEVEGYIEYKKFNNKIKTYTLKNNIYIKPLDKLEDKQKLKIKLKNKIFEKIRKMFDEYKRFDENIILADIVSPEYFESVEDFDEFNDELIFYINHLEENFDEREYFLYIKINEKFGKFDLKNHTYEVL